LPVAAARRSLGPLLVLCISHFFIDLYSSALSAFQPILVDRLGLTLTQAGLLGGLLVFSSSTTQPLYGYLADRLRSRLFTVLAPAVAGIFISLAGVAPSYSIAIALVLLGGAGISSFHPQGTMLAAQGVTENRGRWMAIFISSGTLGLALGPSFLSALAGRFGAESLPFAMIPGLVMTGILFYRIPASSIAAGAAKFDLAPLKAIWKPLTLHYLLVFIRSIVQISFTQFLPLYLNKERGYTLEAASMSLSLYLASGALGGFVGGNLADRFGGRRVILISMIASVPFLAGFFLFGGLASKICLALGGLVLLFTIPVNVTMGQQLAPAHAATVSALMMGFAWGSAGMIFIPLVGLLADHYTLHNALFALTAFPILGFLLALKLPKDA
jgi:FSR family fosmidomycin resistance protein-like MFS transporter